MPNVLKELENQVERWPNTFFVCKDTGTGTVFGDQNRTESKMQLNEFRTLRKSIWLTNLLRSV